MSDLTHDASDDGFHEIQLSGKQLVFLFMATTVVSVVIFLCGVLVGRGVRAERSQIPDPSVATAPAPTDTVADAGPVAAEPPVPPAEAADAPAGAPPVADPDKPAAEPEKTAAETPRALKEQAAPSREQSASAAAPAPPPAVTPPAAEPAPSKRNPSPTTAPTRGTWVVQLVALRDRGMASSIVQRLSGKGYPAFVVNPTAGSAAPVFKVQVGRYADRGEAEQVARRLEKEEQFKPWVSR